MNFIQKSLQIFRDHHQGKDPVEICLTPRSAIILGARGELESCRGLNVSTKRTELNLCAPGSGTRLAIILVDKDLRAAELP